MADLSKVKIEGTSYNIKDASARTGLASKQDTLVSGTNIKTIEGQSLLGSGNIDLTKADVGLGNVDNTSDANKPISTATQTALNKKLGRLLVDGTLPDSSTPVTISLTDDQINTIRSGQVDQILIYNDDSSVTYAFDKMFVNDGEGDYYFYCHLHFGSSSDNRYYAMLEGNSFTIKKVDPAHDSTKQDTLINQTNIKSVDGQSLLGSGNLNSVKMTSITWAALKALRDGGNLVPGQQYRITDYQCMTGQANTSSANHQFDIIVTADSATKLNEKARACLHDGDTYFANNKLEAWELWYSLDNDTTRFAWALVPVDAYLVYNGAKFTRAPSYDGIKGNYAWANGTYCIYTTTLSAPTNGTYWQVFFNNWTSYGNVSVQYVPASSAQGKGVVYRMIDEFGNDCPYDFKNILFTKSGSYSGAYTFTYTQSSTLKDASLLGASKSCYSNVIGAYLVSGVCRLNFTVFYSTTTTFNCYANKIGVGNHDNTIENNIYNNVIGTDFYNNNIGNYFYANIIGDGFQNNVIGRNVYSNDFGSYVLYISIGSSASDNMYVRRCKFDAGVCYLTLTSDDTSATGQNYLQNVHIHSGVQGSSSTNRKTITIPDRNLSYTIDVYPIGSTEIFA